MNLLSNSSKDFKIDASTHCTGCHMCHMANAGVVCGCGCHRAKPCEHCLGAQAATDRFKEFLKAKEEQAPRGEEDM
jgi:hypothetical protein